MKIQILGTGCAKCKMLEENAREAVRVSAIQVEWCCSTDKPITEELIQRVKESLISGLSSV